MVKFGYCSQFHQNFTNSFCIFLPKNYKAKVQFEKSCKKLKTLSYKKAVRKMLVKFDYWCHHYNSSKTTTTILFSFFNCSLQKVPNKLVIVFPPKKWYVSISNKRIFIIIIIISLYLRGLKFVLFFFFHPSETWREITNIYHYYLWNSFLFKLSRHIQLRPCKTGKFPLRPYQNDYGNWQLEWNAELRLTIRITN